VADVSVAALACVATLATLTLSQCEKIRDASALSSESVSLRELNLSSTNVNNVWTCRTIRAVECAVALNASRHRRGRGSWWS
jgi:hypothetical protein